MKYIFINTGEILKQEFDIKDEDGNLVYQIRGNTGMWGAKVSVQDANDNELLLIKQKISYTQSLDVIENGKTVANIRKKVLSLTPKFTISGLNWTVSGKLIKREYTLLDEKGQVVAIINRSGLFAQSAYECEVVDTTVKPDLVLAVVTGIDVAIRQR